MNTNHSIHRRTALKTAAASMLLPLLDHNPLAMADDAIGLSPSTPKRIVYLYFPNGAAEGTWEPKKTGRQGQLLKLNHWMSPLEPFKQHLTIPMNLWMSEGEGHVDGPPNWLTCVGYDEHKSRALGISADQIAAQRNSETMLPSLELSLKGEGFFSNSLPRNAISWTAAGSALPRETEPQVVFDRIFRPADGGATTTQVLEGIRAQAHGLRRRIGRSDQQRLDQYFESLAALERRIDFANRQTKEIAADQALSDTLIRPQAGIPSHHEDYVRQMLDLVVLALQTDATRVVTFMLDHGQSNRYFNFVDGVKGTWHALSHYTDASGNTDDDDGKTRWRSVAEKRAMYCEVNRWHHRQLAYFLARLQSIREPDGQTLLDNCMIVYGSSLGDGDEHGNENLPTLIAGGGGGTIRTGRVIESRGRREISDLHLALLQRMHPRIERFGTSRRALEL